MVLRAFAHLVMVASIATTAMTGSATVSWGKERLIVSSTGPDSTLPSFMFMAGSEEGGDLFSGIYDPPYR